MCNRILVKGTDVDDLSVSPKIRQLMQVIYHPAFDLFLFGSWSLETLRWLRSGRCTARWQLLEPPLPKCFSR